MKNAYSPIDRLASELARPKGTGAEFMTELSKKPGYKQAEVEDRDLQTLMTLPKMAREDFLAALKAKRATVPQEKVLSVEAFPKGLSHAERMLWSREREASGEDAHHEEYTLPGGENYREILLQHPKGGFPGVRAHFGGAPNVLASIRVKDRTVPGEMGYTLRNKKSGLKGQHYGTEEEAQAAIQGYPENLRPMLGVVPSQGPAKKVLHIEEIQSDWHQKGREHGYRPTDLDEQLARAQQALAGAPDLEAMESDPDVPYETHSKALDQYEKLKENFDRLSNLKKSGVPDAPLKKNWHEVALKRMIQHAAEEGYDQIAITPGETQAKRYGLSSHVGMVSYHPGEKHFQAFKPNRETAISERGATPERVEELIGKDAAKRLMAAPATMGHHYLEGEDLNIGGEGMKGFYDKMVPKFLNQFGKKYGAQVGQGAVSIVSTPAQHHGLTEGQFQRQTPEEQERMVRQHAYAHEGAKTAVPVHSFPITPEMRQDVLKNGIPMYAEGGSVDEDDVPRETVKAYKLFRVDKKHPGKLFPLFIGKNEPVGMGSWVPAEHIPTKGFAERPGWHAGDLPMATHIGEKSDTSLTAPDRRPRNQVWTEIEMPNDVDWQTEANKRGTNPHGRVVPVKAHITDQVPTGGHYRYKTNPNMTGSWLIGGSMKVNRVLSDKEVKAINRAAKQADLPRHEPFDPKEFGFAEGGAVGRDENLRKFLDTSKIKDRLYHGTHIWEKDGKQLGDVREFNRNASVDIVGRKPSIDTVGTWMSTNPGKGGAEMYGRTIYPLHAQIKNPYRTTIDQMQKRARLLANGKDDGRKLGEPEVTALREWLKTTGRDGIHIKHDPRSFMTEFKDQDVWIALEPTQIKSAIGNRGTYDPNEPDITKAKGGVVSRETIKPQNVMKNGISMYAEGGAVDNKAKFLEGSKEPGVMYHATSHDFNEFADNPRGVHFVTPSSKWAHKFLSQDGGMPQNALIMPVHVSAKNPFDYENKKHRDALSAKASIGKLGMDEIKKGKWGRIEDRTTLKAIKDLGHDSVYVKENGAKNLGVFSPHQIKSAIGNRGTYDPNEPDITKAKGGSIKPVGHAVVKEKVTISPNMDAMRYELMSAKHFTKKAK